MKKDLNYYLDLLRMDAKIFEQQPDGSWEVSYEKLPNTVGKGVGVADAERNLLKKAEEWIEQSIENGTEVLKKTNKRTVNPVVPRPCPFCGGSNIVVEIASGYGFVGCKDCDYEINTGEVSFFEKRYPVENQAKKSWNKMRPIEDKLVGHILEQQIYIDVLEGVSNGK